MNVFDFAIKMEREIEGHYERLAAQAETEESRTIFELLAQSEREHVGHLTMMKDQTDPAVARSEVMEGVQPRLDRLVRVLSHNEVQEGDADGYRQAVRMEEVSIRLYEKLAEKEHDPAARDLLLMLAREEECHLEEVENIYDFIESPRTYLASGEFSNLSPY